MESCMNAYKCLANRPGPESQVLRFRMLQKVEETAMDHRKLMARFLMVCCYEKGEGVEQDVQKGLRLLEDCARKGLFLAIRRLTALCLEKGDLEQAEKWLTYRKRDNGQFTDLVEALRDRKEERQREQKAEQTAALQSPADTPDLRQNTEEKPGWDDSDGLPAGE